MRAYCSWFNFKGSDQQKKLSVLSGGERNRLQLAKASIPIMSITSHVDLTVRVHGTDLSHIAAALKRGLAASGGEHSLSRAGESRVVFGGSKLVSCYCVADQLYLLGNFEDGSCSIDSRRSQGSVHSVQVLKKKGNLLLLVSLLIFILCLAMYMEVSAASSLLFGDWSSKVLVPTTSSLFAG